ncbi:MAG: flavodoxin family protein [Planctomycetota bacterium]|jgi:multimeric flavodoxin WrbA
MKILAIFGSPRKKGNTAEVLSLFEEKVEKNHEVERINITQHKVGGCLGCYKCQKIDDEPGCVQKDDALTIFERMIQADAIVYASPLYCWSFTSQIKPLIDRHFCLVKGYGTPDHDSLLSGKPAALLVTCAGPIEGNCDAIQHIFNGFSEYVKLTAKGNFILPFCTTPDAIGDEGTELAGNLAKAITE